MAKKRQKRTRNRRSTDSPIAFVEATSEAFGRAWAAYAVEIVRRARIEFVDNDPDPDIELDHDRVMEELLRARLREAEMSQAELARRMGVSQSRVSRMIGSAARLKKANLQKFADALGTPLDQLIPPDLVNNQGSADEKEERAESFDAEDTHT